MPKEASFVIFSLSLVWIVFSFSNTPVKNTGLGRSFCFRPEIVQRPVRYNSKLNTPILKYNDPKRGLIVHGDCHALLMVLLKLNFTRFL